MNISLSPAAADQLHFELDGRYLRIAFTTGCGGSGYRLHFAWEPNEGDQVVKIGDVSIALDDMSYSRLDGAVIMYDDAEGGFTIDHPDAVSAVWCG